MKDRIRLLRRALDMTQDEFAKRLGVKQSTIATYETGRNPPIDSIILSICREFDVSEEWLRTGRGEMFKSAMTDELRALADKYELSEDDMVLVEKFVTLGKGYREAVLAYVRSVADGLQRGEDNEREATDAAEAAYREALGLTQPEESSRSNTSGGIQEPSKKDA